MMNIRYQIYDVWPLTSQTQSNIYYYEIYGIWLLFYRFSNVLAIYAKFHI